MFVQSQDNDKASGSTVDWQSDGPRKSLCKSVGSLCVWEDPVSGKEEEDDESRYMMNSFSRSSDPYNPFNFQAPLRNQRPDKASPSVPSPSECRKKEERLDNALPEASAPTPSKKVRFCDHGEEFILSSENAGHASWQEGTWDRCQEVKGSGYCLQPQRCILVKSQNETIPSIMDFPSSNEEEENQADDEASDSDTKEEDAESLSLFNSFSRSPDPYNPFNFQGPDKASQSVPSPSECRTKEERLDNALPEASAPTPSTSTLSSSFRSQSAKKVRFSDHVEARFLSGEEDRRSPWQEAAVNRFRFQRRCQEVEKIISYCFQPEHRSMVYKYLYPNDTSPTHCVSFTGKNTEEK